MKSCMFILVIASTYKLVFASDDSGAGKSSTDAVAKHYGYPNINFQQFGYPNINFQQFGYPYLNPYGQYPYYDPFYDPYYSEPAPKKSKSSRISPMLVVLMYFLTQSFKTATTTAAPTAAPTVPTTADTCYWGTWQACSATCGGTRTRYRTCSGVQDSQTEKCNHQIYFTSDGWYHASNCHEYSWRDGDWTYDEAVVECSNLGGKLAAVGMRENDIRSEILTKLAASLGVDLDPAWIGVVDSDTNPGTYTWTDGVEAEPTFWATDPTDATADCADMEIGDPFSLEEEDCTNDRSFLCERPA